MKNLFWALFLSFGLGSLSAQSFVKLNNATQNSKMFNADTLRILAVMVEFQADKYDATMGTGKFGSHYTKSYGDTILDPLPHDANYFEDHLLFAKNYFKKVSNGKLNISFKVLPQSITVSKYMKDYSTGYKSNDFSPLSEFAKEVWTIADKQNPNFKFSNYDLFIIFHAGISNGLQTGIFSIDRNLPSLYLSLETLKKTFGNNFAGIPTSNGLIKNSIILPETESREETMIDDSVVLQEVSINGAIVGNIGSHIGLPDLLNTETGLSAIGRFGLMDGQAIGASYGMFPPEPSAWEKIYMGWESPKTASVLPNRYNVSTRQTAGIADTTLLKVPINANEFYLVENRVQDAKKDKVILTIKKSGKIYTKVINPDTSGVFYVEPSKIDGGVVIDVDEFDASLPGSGIVIWHIDDEVIKAKFAENKINNDFNKKGVAVEEADGIEDIGKQYESIFGTIIGDGSYEDFWHSGNKAKLYKNKFGSETKPSTKSNYGSSSLITFEKFSALSNKIGFNLNFGVDYPKLVSSSIVNLSSAKKYIAAKSFSAKPYLYIIDNSTLLKYDIEGKQLKSFSNFSNIQPSVFEYNGVEYIVGANGKKINVLTKSLTEEKLLVVDCYNDITTLSADVRKDKSPKILIGLFGAKAEAVAVELDYLLMNSKIDQQTPGKFGEGTAKIKNFAISSSTYSILFENGIAEYSFAQTPNTFIPISSTAKKAVLAKDGRGKIFTVTLVSGNQVIVSSNGSITSKFFINSSTEINSFSVADIFNNGSLALLASNGKYVYVYSMNGNLIDNFPFETRNGELFTNAPLVADINNDSVNEIVVVTNSGNMYAINPTTAKLLPAFPINVGIDPEVTPIILAEELPTMGPLPVYKPYIVSLDKSQRLNIYQIGNTLGKNYWTSEFSTGYNSSFVEASITVNATTEYFPKDKVYNWPNPVYNGTTYIRYYLSEDSDVKIKIFDLAGSLVAELTNKGRGGFDNETIWDVTKVQSGVYYANVEVSSSKGQSANKIIKIAVIK